MFKGKTALVTGSTSGIGLAIASAFADQVDAMMKRALEAFGAIDILVNNAGIQHIAPVEEFPPARWDAIIALSLTASFHTIRHAVTGMKARKWGRIINIASAHALVASPFKSAYVAAKHGIAGLAVFLASDAAASITGAIVPVDGGWTAH